MTHAHITTWVLSIILLIVILIMQKQGKNTKVLHMILRVFYLLILATGILYLKVTSRDYFNWSVRDGPSQR